MDLPVELKNRIEALAASCSTKELIATSKKITKMYQEESGHGKRLVSQNQESLVYAIVRMPATYGAVSSTLEKVFDHYEGNIQTVLDLGAGTGAAFWAIYNQIDFQKYTCIERENAMIQTGKRLMDQLNDTIDVEWIREDLNSIDSSLHADLIIASYALNELSKDRREILIEKLWNMTNSLLVIIEPGTKAGYGVVKEIREQLLEKGGNLVGPCTHTNCCPLKEDDWCHFSVRIQRSKLHKLIKEADVPYEDEKFTFIAFSKEECKLSGSRILRHPIIESGRITLRLCNENGIEEKVITKKDKVHFKTARKADAGDLYEK